MERIANNNKHWLLQLAAIIVSLYFLCPGKGMLGLICSSLSSCRANSHSMFFLSPKLGVRSPVFKKRDSFLCFNSVCLSVSLSVFVCICLHVYRSGHTWVWVPLEFWREAFMSCPMGTRKQSQVFCPNSKHSKSPSHPSSLSPFIFKAFLPCQEQPEFHSLSSLQLTYLKDPPMFICSVANST